MRVIQSLSVRCVKALAIGLVSCALAGPALAESKKAKELECGQPNKKEFRKLTILDDGRRVTTMMDVLGRQSGAKPSKPASESDAEESKPKRSDTAKVSVQTKREVPNS